LSIKRCIQSSYRREVSLTSISWSWLCVVFFFLPRDALYMAMIWYLSGGRKNPSKVIQSRSGWNGRWTASSSSLLPLLFFTCTCLRHHAGCRKFKTSITRNS
jgi:hypothetical protein